MICPVHGEVGNQIRYELGIGYVCNRVVGSRPPLMYPTSTGMAPVGPPMPVTCNQPVRLNEAEASVENVRREAEARRVHTASDALRDARDLDEIAGILERSADSLPREQVEETWRRLSQAGTLGAPMHDIVTVQAGWSGGPGHGTFEFGREISRQQAWLARNAMPFEIEEGLDISTVFKGRMDVWIAADGRTFRREEIFRGAEGKTLHEHDAALTYSLRNRGAQRPVTVAVPVGEPPRTLTEKKLLLPRETKGLRDTIVLADERLGPATSGIRGTRPRLAPALAALLRSIQTSER